MARGRMLNKTVSLSLKFHDLPDDTCRLLATWIITQLDYRGVFYADPAVVKSLVFPRRVDVSLDDIADYLNAMQMAGLIELFDVRGELWQYWPGFAHNQIGLRAERERTEYPPPPGWVEETDQPEDDESPPDDGELPEECRQDAAEKPAEEKVKDKVKLSEVKENTAAIAATPPEPPAKPPPKPKKTKAPPKPIPEAVKVFQQNAHRYPAKAWYDKVSEAVGEEPDDLERWGALVLEWVGRGWNPTNVAGMLDAFKNGGLKAGPKQAAPGKSGPDRWLEKRQQVGMAQ